MLCRQMATLQHKLLTCVMFAVASVCRLYQQCRWAPSTPNLPPKVLPGVFCFHATTVQGRQRISNGCWSLAGYVADLMSPLFPGAFLLLACIGSLSRAITGECRSHQEHPIASDDIHELTVPQIQCSMPRSHAQQMIDHALNAFCRCGWGCHAGSADSTLCACWQCS